MTGLQHRSLNDDRRCNSLGGRCSAAAPLPRYITSITSPVKLKFQHLNIKFCKCFGGERQVGTKGEDAVSFTFHVRDRVARLFPRRVYDRTSQRRNERGGSNLFG